MSDVLPIGELQPILRIHDVIALTGRGRSSIYEDINAGHFPPGVKLGPRSVGWLRSDVVGWLAARVAERDAGVSKGARSAGRG